MLGARLLQRQQHGIALGDGEVQPVYRDGLQVDAIRLHNGHLMALDLKVGTDKAAHIDDAEEVRLALLDVDRDVLAAVDDARVRYGFGPARRRIFGRLVLLDQEGGLGMVPIAQRNRTFPINLVLVGSVRVFEVHRTPQTVGHLAFDMGVPPVRPSLHDLR